MEFRSRTYLLLIFVLVFSKIQAQFVPSNLTPGGVFDRVYNNRGDVYQLADLMISRGKPLGSSNTVAAVPTQSCKAGFFTLFFQPGSVWTNSASLANGACQVFTDLSNFIYSPLTTTSLQVNIFCGDLPPNQNALASANSYYLFPSTPSNPQQGVTDCLVNQMIITGQDPYNNVPMAFNSISMSTVTQNFYHAELYIKSLPAPPNNFYPWYTNFSSISGTSGLDWDLYTALLHEATHLLGFHSLIDASGGFPSLEL